jgi:hypothetical protein
VSKKNRIKQYKSASKDSVQKPERKAWVSPKDGIVIVTLASLFAGGFTAFKAAPALGWGEAILWGLLYGASIWIIFFAVIFIMGRVIRR